MLNRLVVKNVDRVRLSMSLGDSKLPEGLQSFINQEATNVIESLGNDIITANPPFLLTQEKHDAMFAE